MYRKGNFIVNKYGFVLMLVIGSNLYSMNEKDQPTITFSNSDRVITQEARVFRRAKYVKRKEWIEEHLRKAQTSSTASSSSIGNTSDTLSESEF